MSSSICLQNNPTLSWPKPKRAGGNITLNVTPELLALKEKYQTPKLYLETDYYQLNSYSRIARSAYGQDYREVNPSRPAGAEQYWPFIYLYNVLNCDTYDKLSKAKRQFDPNYLKLGQSIQIPPIGFINECIALVSAGKLKLFSGAPERFRKLLESNSTETAELGTKPSAEGASANASAPPAISIPPAIAIPPTIVLVPQAGEVGDPPPEAVRAENQPPAASIATPVIAAPPTTPVQLADSGPPAGQPPSPARATETKGSSITDTIAKLWSRTKEYFLGPKTY